MKFDRASPRAWVYFFVTAVNIVVASAISYLVPRRTRKRRRAVLSGHVFNGNLRAFYDRAGRDAEGWDIRYVYIDHAAYRSRDAASGRALSALRLDHMIWVARADAVVTDHGPGIWALLQILRSNIAFVEVWHGVGFKGLGSEFAKKMTRYRALFAASEWDGRDALASGGRAAQEKVVATGYAAVDPLVHPQPTGSIVARYPLPRDRAGQILIAPTWNHGDPKRSLFPFDLNEEEFLTRLNNWARGENWTVVFRAHLNTPAIGSGGYPNVAFMPLAEYPLTYDILSMSDVLVTDWSSIATDYLVLGRPSIFIDVPPPFLPDHLTADDRVGYRVRDWDGFVEALTAASKRPTEYAELFASERERVLAKAFGSTLDGCSAARYLEELDRIVSGAKA